MSTPEAELEERDALLRELIAAGDAEALERMTRDLHPSDLADMVEGLEEDERVVFVSALPAELASETVAEMEGGEIRADLLEALSPEKRAELFHELADDDAADLLGELEPDVQQRVLEGLPADEPFRGLLIHAEDTAGGLMTTELVAVSAFLTAAEALEQVRRQGRQIENFYTVFVVDERRKLLGTLRLDDLIIAEPGASIETLVEAPIATVVPEMDQEHVGRLIGRYNLAAIPVVDGEGTLLGRITFDDVIDVIEAEQTEDIFRLAGVTDEHEMRYSWTESARVRLPWLLLHLGASTVAASAILLFEDLIAQVVTLAFLAPIIAAMGGGSGTQSLAITIRRIAIEGTGSARGYVAKEMLIGLVNGAVLGSVIAGVAWYLDGNPRLGLVVFLAMWANQVVAGFAGAFIPATLDRLGLDPSVASSVFVQTLTDLCGFFLLLGLASQLLLG